jgi:chondroitin AC lyase
MRPYVLPLLLLFSFATAASGSELDVVRNQFIGYYTAAGADRSLPRMQNAVAELESVALQITGPTWLRSDGSFLDIDYSGVPSGGWGPWDHTRRLIVMAKAWNTPGHRLYRDPVLLTQINAALAFTKTFYGTHILPEGNWWFWTIGIPIDLGPALVLMQGHADPAIVADLTNAIRLRIGNAPTKRGISGPVPVGQNLVWSSFTHLCVALLRDDATLLHSVRDAMATVARPSPIEGIKEDFSFHQHGRQLYTGGYGGSFANDVARHALITGGTTYALPPDALASFASYMTEGIAWSLHGRHFDVSVVGREVARSSTTGYNGVAALVQASWIETPRQAEIRAAAAKMLESWSGSLPTELAGLASRVESSRITAAWPEGYRHYFASDYSAHRRDGWFASVKMFSTRTKSGESTNEENLRGARQSDGRFHLVLRGDEYFERNVWPTIDWTRLPGTTVEQKTDTASNHYGYGTRTFAGGTGNGHAGISAMELAPLKSSLTARKSWIFFDDAIVFLTNSIRSASANRIETIVNQWPLLDPRSSVVRQGDWAVLERVGYWFPDGAPVITRETRSGNWASLGGSVDRTAHSNTFVTLLYDHGVAPVNEAIEYAIVPGTSPSAMAAWSSQKPIAILSNDDTVSAARDRRTGDTCITFWRAGAIEGIESNAAAVVFVSGDGMRLDVADPNAGNSGTIELTIPGSWVTDDVPVVRSYRATTLLIPRNGGRTTTVNLERAMPKRRAVR